MLDLVEFQGEIYSPEIGTKLVNARGKLERRIVKAHAITDRLRDLAPDDTRVQSIITAIDADDFITASKEFSSLSRRRTALTSPSRTGRAGPAGDIALSGIENMRKTVRDAAAAQKRLERLQADNPPARFVPKLQEEIARRLGKAYADKYLREYRAGRMTKAEMDDALPKLAAAVTDNIYADIPGFNIDDLRGIQRDVQTSWQKLKAAGFDPIYVHHIHPDRAALSIKYPSVSWTEATPSQLKTRTLDLSPAVDDVTIALTHQGLELLVKEGSTDYAHSIMSLWGKTDDALRQELMPAAQAAFRRDSSVSLLTHFDRLLRARYTAFEPGNLIRSLGGTPKTGLPTDTIFIPKSIANNLRRMKPPDAPRVTALLDPALNAFRTSLLPLSPRWHVYNIMGGAIMTMARTSPTVWFRTAEAFRILRDPAGRASLPRDFARILGTANHDIMELSYYSGRTMRRLLDEAGEKHPALTKARAAGSKLIEKSFEFNAFFDDMYRTMGYLYHRDRLLSKGMSRSVAETAGVEMARRVMQSWDEMTPIERSVIRQVFPFYGFMQHIIRYTMKYPFDHPVRASIMATFGRNELEDLGTGLPQTFLNMFTFGSPDAKGNVKAINTGGFNPFADVANYMTMAGFLGSTNPIISSILQTAGVDTRTGGPELFPNLSYDPETGQLVANTGNPLFNLVRNTIPQTQILGELLGTNTEFRELLRSNPDAAMRMIRSQMGLPVLFRHVNPTQMAMTEEVQRSTAQHDALLEAVKTGDTSKASRYPGLQPLLGQLTQLRASGALSPYALPQQSLPAAQSTLARALNPLAG